MTPKADTNSTLAPVTNREMVGLALEGVPHPSDLAPHLKRRYDRIVLAAVQLLDDADYEDIPIRAVSDRAGVALATLYRYFTSKEHLYAAAMLEWSARFRIQMGKQYRPARDAETTAAAINRVVRAYTKYPRITRVHTLLEQSIDPNACAIRERYAQISDRSVYAICQWLPEDVAPMVATALLAVLYDGLRRWSIGSWSSRQVEGAVRDAVDLVIVGADNLTTMPRRA